MLPTQGHAFKLCLIFPFRSNPIVIIFVHKCVSVFLTVFLGKDPPERVISKCFQRQLWLLATTSVLLGVLYFSKQNIRRYYVLRCGEKLWLEEGLVEGHLCRCVCLLSSGIRSGWLGVSFPHAFWKLAERCSHGSGKMNKLPCPESSRGPPFPDQVASHTRVA